MSSSPENKENTINPLMEIASSINKVIENHSNDFSCVNYKRDLEDKNIKDSIKQLKIINTKLPDDTEKMLNIKINQDEKKRNFDEYNKLGWFKKIYSKELRHKNQLYDPKEQTTNIKVTKPFTEKYKSVQFDTYPDAKRYFLKEISFEGNLEVHNDLFVFTHNQPIYLLNRTNYDPNDNFQQYTYKNTEIEYVIAPHLNKIFCPSNKDGYVSYVAITQPDKIETEMKNINNILNKIKY